MVLRSRKLPAAGKKSVICGGGTSAPVERVSRAHGTGKKYQHTFFAGLTRVQATSLVKRMLLDAADEIEDGQYDDASLTRIEQCLSQWEAIEERSKSQSDS